MGMNDKTIGFDFDGVIHKYRKGWQDGSIYDEMSYPILKVMNELLNAGYSVVIITTRDRKQIKKNFDWLNRLPAEGAIPFKYKTLPLWQKFFNKKDVVGITNRKVACSVFVDDRAIRFDPKRKNITFEKLVNFKPFKYYNNR